LDESRPLSHHWLRNEKGLGFDNQALISNRRKLLRSKATVMKAEKSKQDF
jgi:hypothetical protein